MDMTPSDEKAFYGILVIARRAGAKCDEPFRTTRARSLLEAA